MNTATTGAALLLLGLVSAASAGTDEPAAAEFFEKEVRPILVERCQGCHNGEKSRGGLKLTARASLIEGGHSGPAAVPGDPGHSLLIEAVERRGDLKMPPKGRLSDGEVDRFRRWVALGLPWPGGTSDPPRDSGASIDEKRRRWAFRPVQAEEPPPVREASWPRSAIDRFILAGLEAEGLAPSRPADRRTLIRRATFDLIGLPPTPEEVEAFEKDGSPEAFARVVDRLLASPRYGERWARNWLDVVRYTDYFYPEPNAHPRAALFELFEAWRYRDWVVDALNRDMPYDQFIVHQIAGDLLPAPGGEPVYADGLVATGLLALSVFDNGDADKEKIVSDIVDDQIDVVGKAFLGLTLACARCHDHKFDPIRQDDYYGLAGIFYSTHILAEVGAKGDHTVALRVPLVPPSYLERRERQLRSQTGMDALAAGLDLLRGPAARGQLLVASSRVAEAAGRGPTAWLLGELARRVPSGMEAARARVLRARNDLKAELLPEAPLALAAREGGTPGGLFPGIQDVPLHVRGSYTRLGPVVPRHFPRVLAAEGQAPLASGSGRLELARWIARAENPLTARVLVNRVWQHHFGEGIVRTSTNFGKLGEPPSHPRLLDWLADRFVRDGWSIKRLHRHIMLSATYQQSGAADERSLRRDPDNRKLGRMEPRRLEAEAIRDAMLAVAGRLDPASGGPATADLDRPRRSLYVQTARQDRGNFSTLFDAANPEAPVERRTVSTVAPQALFLLNGRFSLDQAGHLSRRLVADVPEGDEARINRAYRLLYGRRASTEEVAIGRDFLARAAPRGVEAAWTDFAHVLLCSNEFLYID